MNTTQWRIIEIMPATGWRAGMRVGSTIDYLVLVGWALVEDENHNRFVTGLVSSPSEKHAVFAASYTQFMHYNSIL